MVAFQYTILTINFQVTQNLQFNFSGLIIWTSCLTNVSQSDSQVTRPKTDQFTSEETSCMSKLQGKSKVLFIYLATAILYHLTQVKIYVLHKKGKDKARAILVQKWKGFYSTEQRWALYQITVASRYLENKHVRIWACRNIQSSVMSYIYLMTKNSKTSQISTLTSYREIIFWYLLPF